MEVGVAEYPKRGSQRRKPLWTVKEGTLGVSRRQCESQGDQINPVKALDSKSTKHCPYSDSCSVQESQQLCWPPAPHTPLVTTLRHSELTYSKARPQCVEQNRATSLWADSPATTRMGASTRGPQWGNTWPGVPKSPNVPCSSPDTTTAPDT